MGEVYLTTYKDGLRLPANQIMRILQGKQRYVVLPNFDRHLSAHPLYLLQDGYVFGAVQLRTPEIWSLQEMQSTENLHGINEEERQLLFGNPDNYYAYEVTLLEKFAAPKLAYGIPKGPHQMGYYVKEVEFSDQSVTSTTTSGLSGLQGKKFLAKRKKLKQIADTYKFSQEDLEFISTCSDIMPTLKSVYPSDFMPLPHVNSFEYSEGNIELHAPTLVVDKKVDGDRLQIHKAHGEILIYNKDGVEVTPYLEELSDAARGLSEKDLIVDGIFNSKDRSFHCYDLLYLEKPLSDLTFADRRKEMKQLKFSDRIKEVNSTLVSTKEDLSAAINLMNKLPNASGIFVRDALAKYEDSWIAVNRG